MLLIDEGSLNWINILLFAENCLCTDSEECVEIHFRCAMKMKKAENIRPFHSIGAIVYCTRSPAQ